MLYQILLIVHIIVKKLWKRKREERKERKRRRKKIVVTSDGTLFCRLQRKENKGEETEEKEASKWDQLTD